MVHLTVFLYTLNKKHLLQNNGQNAVKQERIDQ